MRNAQKCPDLFSKHRLACRSPVDANTIASMKWPSLTLKPRADASSPAYNMLDAIDDHTDDIIIYTRIDEDFYVINTFITEALIYCRRAYKLINCEPSLPVYKHYFHLCRGSILGRCLMSVETVLYLLRLRPYFHYVNVIAKLKHFSKYSNNIYADSDSAK